MSTGFLRRVRPRRFVYLTIPGDWAILNPYTEAFMILEECKIPIAELRASVDEIWGRL